MTPIEKAQGLGPTMGAELRRVGADASAGSARIAREWGWNSIQADEAAALETTLNRLRQRYALYFNLPAGVVAGDRRSVDIQLEETVARRYPEATVRYRRSYVAAASSGSGAPTEEVLETVPLRTEPRTAPPVSRRRTMDGSSSGPSIVVHSVGWCGRLILAADCVCHYETRGCK